MWTCGQRSRQHDHTHGCMGSKAKVPHVPPAQYSLPLTQEWGRGRPEGHAGVSHMHASTPSTSHLLLTIICTPLAYPRQHTISQSHTTFPTSPDSALTILAEECATCDLAPHVKVAQFPGSEDDVLPRVPYSLTNVLLHTHRELSRIFHTPDTVGSKGEMGVWAARRQAPPVGWVAGNILRWRGLVWGYWVE